MVARLVRLVWLAVLAAMLGAAALSIRWFGPRIGLPAAGLAGVFAVLLVHPLVVACNFALSRRFGDAVPGHLQLSPWRALLLFDGEVDASMRGFWFATPLFGTRPAPTPAAGSTARDHALLFVHGYFCNRAIWTSFLRDAASRGFVVEAIALEPAFGPIEDHADALARAIDALLDRARALGRPVERVVVVAHSMGGLVARSALRDIDASRVAHVITLGTPHRGTFAAKFGRAANVVQMRPGSAWLEALERREADGASGLPRTAFTSIGSAHDEIVYPQRTALLDGSRQVLLGGIGHVALASHPRIRALVFERLDELASGADTRVDVDVGVDVGVDRQPAAGA